MLIATFVRCLSYLLKSYISFRYLCYRSDRGQNGRNLLDTNKLLKADSLYKERKYACQIYGRRTAVGSKDIFDRHISRLERRELMSSTLQCR